MLIRIAVLLRPSQFFFLILQAIWFKEANHHWDFHHICKFSAGHFQSSQVLSLVWDTCLIHNAFSNTGPCLEGLIFLTLLWGWSELYDTQQQAFYNELHDSLNRQLMFIKCLTAWLADYAKPCHFTIALLLSLLLSSILYY